MFLKSAALKPQHAVLPGSIEAPSPKKEETPAPVAAVKEKLPSLDAAKPDDNPLAGLFSSCKHLPLRFLQPYCAVE